MKRDTNPERGLEALDQCEHMVPAVTDGEGKPYCIPLNGVRAGEKVYLHCVKAGEKVDYLRTHPQVCLTAVGHQRMIQTIHETEYQYAVVRGTVGEVTGEAEMRETLWALCRKYSSDCLEQVEQVVDDSFARMAIWKVCTESVSGRWRDYSGQGWPEVCMWILYASASAFFVRVTAVLAKLDMEEVNSRSAMALRTIVVALFGWTMVWVADSSDAVGALEPRSWLFLALPGLATGGNQLCYFRALQLGETNQVASVDKPSTVLTMLLSTLLLGEAAHWNTLLGMGLVLTGTPGMLQRKPRERASSGQGWLPWAVLSAVCTSLTPILGKVGTTGVDSYVGTAIRNMVVLAMARALVLGLGLQREIPALSRKNWGLLTVSGVSTGLSWMFYYRALQEGPASVVAPIDKPSILVTVSFSCLVLREWLSRRATVGLLVFTCGTPLLLL